MKKVIVYRNQLLPPSETFIRQQALALRSWQATVVGERLVANGLDLAGLDVRLLRNDPSARLENLRYQLSRWLWQPHAPIARVLAGLNADLIHVHFGTDATDLWPSIRALGRPVLVTLHGYDINIHRAWWEAGHGGLIRRRYPQRLLQLAAEPMVRFIAVSRAIRDRAIQFGIPSSRLALHHIGVDCNAFHPGPVPVTKRNRRILFVGRLTEKKGVEHLIRALLLVRRHVSDAMLVIAGSGPLRPSLLALAKSLSLPVEFLGAVSSDEVRQQMQQARVFCLPSITAANGDAEGFGMVLLEAQACGIPVVSSARGGAEEGLLDNETGFRVKEAAVDVLAEKLVKLLLDDDLAESFSARGAAFVRERFDLRACTRLLEAIYDHSIQPRS